MFDTYTLIRLLCFYPLNIKDIVFNAYHVIILTDLICEPTLRTGFC